LFDLKPVSPLSNRSHKCKHLAFLCSSPPEAFLHPDRGTGWPARAGAVKVGRRFVLTARVNVSRPCLDSIEHAGRLVDLGGTALPKPSPALPGYANDSRCQITALYAVQRLFRPQHGPQGFDAAMPRTRSVTQEE
jgi:hypothetical protein